MPINSRQVQTETQQQVQTLSPQQIMVVKLLELPTIELEERIHSELLDNPALEEGKEKTDTSDSTDEDFDEYQQEDENYTDSNEDLSLGDYSSEDDIPDYKLQENNHSRGERAEDIPFSDSISFYETIKEQLDMQDISAQEKEIGEYIIGSLNDDGLLYKSLENLVDEYEITYGQMTSVEEFEHVLNIIQTFDPAGIGARNLQECLLLQIKRKKASPTTSLCMEVISNLYDEFSKNNKDKIIQRLGISEEEYTQVMTELTKLNPRPGSSLGESIGKNLQQIIPDFIVETDEETITLSLNNQNVPELRLSREFTEMLEEQTKNKKNQTRGSKDAFMFLKQKVDAAQNFINAVKQRQQTLISTMQAIVDMQRTFFIEGDETLLRPMKLKDIAERTKLDISTISRVSNSKYVQTNFGIYPLKFFFNDSYTNENGEEMSVRKIKNMLKEYIDNENKEKPYTDDELAELLTQKGYPIARRTISKYRQQMNIPVAKYRK